MNKIVSIVVDKISQPFPEILNFFNTIYKGTYQEYMDVGRPRYISFVEMYYIDNFGIELFDWAGTYDKRGRIINDSKFNLFMLKYSHHIRKISYE
jgi:hypothetical protein